jgi:hypothetical protein
MPPPPTVQKPIPPPQSINWTRDSRKFKSFITTMEWGRIKNTSASIHELIEQAVTSCLNNKGGSHTAEVQWIQDPSPELEEIYQILLGRTWRRRVNDLLEQGERYRPTADTALEGMIGAAVWKEVLQKPLPWDMMKQV